MRPGRMQAVRCSALLPVLLLPLSLLSGQVPEERRYAPAETLACDFAFAVFAEVDGEPRTVRRCPGGDGDSVSFASRPVLALPHLDSVAAVPARSGSWRVDVRLTEEGVRRLEQAEPEGRPAPLGVVLDGRVVARFTPRRGVRSDRVTVLAGVSGSRARAVADRLRTQARRASTRRDGGLWRLLWHPRPGGRAGQRLPERPGAAARPVRIRSELPSDVPCEPGAREPAGEHPAVFVIEVDALFRPDGTARIVPTYPRGC